MSEQLKILRTQIPFNKSVTLVGGAFDLLHPGHLHVLDFAKKLGDILVVSVLSDKYIKSYKGDSRPVMPENYRLMMIKSVKMVDYAFIADSSSYSLDNLLILKPNNLVFGNDDSPARKEKVKRQKMDIRAQFPCIAFHDLDRFNDPSMSTTELIKKINNL